MRNIKFILFAIVILIAAADSENTTFFMIKSIVCFLILVITALRISEQEEKNEINSWSKLDEFI